MPAVITPLIGASLLQVWKPPGGVTVPPQAADATAPFELGTIVWASPGKVAVFCRVGATGIAIGATAGITNGVTVAAAAGNTFLNGTGQALVTGDYAFLTSTVVLTP
jgi:hypothetical protein